MQQGIQEGGCVDGVEVDGRCVMFWQFVVSDVLFCVAFVLLAAHEWRD